MTLNTDKPSDVVFTGIGMITSHGCGIDANLEALEHPPQRTSAEDYYVRGFNPAPHLSDRKVVKVVSARDVLGLVAFEDSVRSAGIKKDTINPDRTGLYIGAPPSACTDNLNYAEGVEASRNAYGELQEDAFGLHYRSASPTTLLTGLPNNVLCYGSKTLDARGPNSNYTCLETSGHLSIIGAARAMRLGRLDCAIAGGYSAHSDPVHTASVRRRGLLKQPSTGAFAITPYRNIKEDVGTISAEGAAFVAMELRAVAAARGAIPFATLLACGMASDAKGPFAIDQNGSFPSLLRRVIKKAGVDTSQVGVVLLTGSGIAAVDTLELSAVHELFLLAKTKPVLATTSPAWGNLMEAGGVGELGVLKHAFKTGAMPQSTIIGDSHSANHFNKDQNIALIVRASPWGEYTCLVVRMEGRPT